MYLNLIQKIDAYWDSPLALHPSGVFCGGIPYNLDSSASRAMLAHKLHMDLLDRGVGITYINMPYPISDDDEEIEHSIEWERPLNAPFSRGEVYGRDILEVYLKAWLAERESVQEHIERNYGR